MLNVNFKHEAVVTHAPDQVCGCVEAHKFNGKIVLRDEVIDRLSPGV